MNTAELPAVGRASTGTRDVHDTDRNDVDSAPARDQVIPEPWKHQREAIEKILSRRSTLLDMGMGTGKSRCVVEAWKHLRPNLTVILAPKSVVAVWPKQFEDWGALPASQVVTFKKQKTWQKRTDELRQRVEQSALRGRPLVVVINYEAVMSRHLYLFLREAKPDLLVFDECHRLKSPNGKISKYAARLAEQSRRVVGLTGTPMPHSPLDIWAQFRALDPNVFGSSFFRFKNRYAQLGGYLGKQVIGFHDTDQIADRMAEYTYHASRDVLDLPEALHEIVPVSLCPKAERMYHSLDRDMIAFIEEMGAEVTPANALVKLLRLMQLTSGVAKPDDADPVRVDSSKLEALSDLFDAAGGEPFVVFGKFTCDMDSVHEAAKKLGLKSGELSGRSNDLAEWQAGETQVLAVQMQAGGVGIDLTRARYCAYLSTGYSLGDYEQSLARVHRPGQDRPVTYYHLTATGTVDEKVQKALAERRDVVESVLAQYRDQQKETA